MVTPPKKRVLYTVHPSIWFGDIWCIYIQFVFSQGILGLWFKKKYGDRRQLIYLDDYREMLLVLFAACFFWTHLAANSREFGSLITTTGPEKSTGWKVRYMIGWTVTWNKAATTTTTTRCKILKERWSDEMRWVFGWFWKLSKTVMFDVCSQSHLGCNRFNLISRNDGNQCSRLQLVRKNNHERKTGFMLRVISAWSCISFVLVCQFLCCDGTFDITETFTLLEICNHSAQVNHVITSSLHPPKIRLDKPNGTFACTRWTME